APYLPSSKEKRLDDQKELLGGFLSSTGVYMLVDKNISWPFTLYFVAYIRRSCLFFSIMVHFGDSGQLLTSSPEALLCCKYWLALLFVYQVQSLLVAQVQTVLAFANANVSFQIAF
ncbi:unnamed protein product, partial [Notodromas monacha]